MIAGLPVDTFDGLGELKNLVLQPEFRVVAGDELSEFISLVKSGEELGMSWGLSWGLP
jgi:hypothetical protein